MGRHLFRALWAHGFVRAPERTDEQKAVRRRMLLERLEDRLLFDAGPVAPIDADAELAKQAAAQEAMPLENSIAEPAEVRLIQELDDLETMVADLTESAANRENELIPDSDSSDSATVDGATTSAIDANGNDASLAGALLNSDEVAEQLLTTSDEQQTELQAATADVRHELVFVDSAVEDYQTLLAGVDPRAEVFLLDTNRDGVEQMLEVLSQRSGLDAIHIVSHGSMGELQLGTATLNLDSMYDRYAEQLGRIGQALAADADILIYGCNFAEGLLGRAAEESLAVLTGADVAASSDATGNAAIGGDWDLERSVGVIESNIAFGAQAQEDWQYLLAVLDWDTVDWTSGSLSQSFSVGGGTVSFAITGDTDDFFSGSPDDDTTNSGGLSPVQESVLLDMNFESQTTIGDEAVTVTIGFSHTGGVSNVSFTIFDVDLSTWTDQIIVTANNGATINPSSVTVGSTVTFDGVNKVTGTSSNSSTSANGNAAFTFNQSGITQITMVYQSGRLGDPSEQFISLHDITFNVAPVLDLDASGAGTGFSNTFTEDGSAVRIADTDSLITDTDSTNLNRATVTLTNPQTNDLLSVSGSLPAGISLDPSSTSTLIVLTGSSSLANYETAIEQIRFSNSSQTPNTTARTITVNVRDTSNATSNTATSTISVVSVNDAPTGGNRTVTTSEDTDYTFTTSDFPFSDADGDSLTRVRIDTLPADGTVLLSGVAVTAGQVITVANITSGNLTFRPDTNENGSPYTTFTFSVGEASAFAASPSTMTVNVTPVNDAPTGGNRTVTTAEDTDFTFTTSDFPFSDVDGGTIARVRIDTLPTDGTVLLSGVAVTAGQIITAANITSGNLTFRPDTNENGSPYTTFTFSVGDASTFVASPSTMTVNVTPVNDAPTGGNRTVTTAEDTDFTFTTSDFPFSDIDGDSLARVRIDTLPVDGTVLLSGVAVTAGQIITAASITAGNLTFRPDANENGSPYTTFTFSVGDASAFAASPSTMTVNVTTVNDVPTGGDQTVTTAEDTDFTFSTSDFPFSDVDGGAIARVRIDTLPADGTVLLSGVAVTAGQIITAANITAGNLKFRPDANENGSPYATFTFSVGDATTFAASASTMTVNVTPVNDAPIGGDQTVTTAEDTDFTFTTSDFPFSDVDGGTLARVRIDTLPTDGTVLLGGVAVTAGQIITAANITAGNLTFRPDANENGSPYTTFTFSVGDASLFAASPSTMTVNVTPVNDAPTGGDQTVTTNEDTDFTFAASDFPFSDVDGETLARVRIDSLPADGTVLFSGAAVTAGQIISAANITAGDLTFRPDSNENGSPYTTFTFSVGDASTFAVSSSTMTVNVTPVNDPPVADDETFTVAEGDSVIIPVLIGDTDLEGDSLIVTQIDGKLIAVGTPVTIATGLVSLNADGTLTFTPNNGYNGPVSFNYRVSDGNGGSDVGNVSGDVTAVNDPPLAVADSAMTAANSTVTGDVLANDTDPDADTLTVSEVDGAPGNVGSAVAGSDGGTFTINADGSYSFDPGADFNDLTTSQSRSTTISYTASDGNGGTSTTTLTATVSGASDPPTSTAIPDRTNDDGDSVIVDVSGHFSDPDVSEVLTFSALDLPANLSINALTGVISGTLAANASASSPYSVTITATDRDGAFTSQTFQWFVNNVPVSPFDDFNSTPEHVPASGNVLDNDVDPDGDPLTVAAINGVPGNVGVSVTGSQGGEFVVQTDGSYTFNTGTDFDDLAPGDSRSTSIFYTTDDGNGSAVVARLTVLVTGTNDPPISTAIPAQTSLDSDAVTFGVASYFSDPDANDLLVYSATDLPPGLSIDPDTGVISGTIDPAASVGGPYSVEVTATDLAGLTTSQVFTWTVTNPAPTAGNDSFTTAEDTPLNDSVTANDSDPDGDSLTYSLVTGPTNGLLTLNNDGTFTYTPNPNFRGPDSFRYQASDGQGGTASALVTLTVTSIDDAPTSADNSVTTPEDSDFVFSASDFPFNDVDGDPLAEVRIDSLPADGTLLLDGVAVLANDVIDVADLNAGLLVFRPDANENGSPYTTFNFSVSDGTLFADSTSTLTVHVTPVNDPPVADDDSVTTDEDTPIVIDVLGGDTDLDGTLDPTSVIITSTPSGATLAPDGKTLTVPGEGVWTVDIFTGAITFAPETNYHGAVTTITYQVTDNQGATDSADVSVTLTSVNDAPTGADNSVTTAEDTDFVFSASDFPFNDVDGDVLAEVRIDSLPADGTLLLNGVAVSANDIIDIADINAGLLIFRPDANENGSPYTTFDFSVGDGTLFADSPSTLTVHVTPVNDPPVADDESVTTGEDTPVAIDVVNGDTDLDGTIDPTSVIITSTPPGATLAPDGKTLTVPGEGVWSVDLVTGAITFTPELNYNGPVTTITYQVADDLGATDTADISVAIVAVNNAPTSANNTVTTPEDTDFVFSASDFPFNDVEGDPLTAIRIDSLPAEGSLWLDGMPVGVNDVINVADINAGLLVFRPDTDENGSPYTTFDFSVSDGTSFSAASNTMTVNVTPTTVAVLKSLFDSSDPNTLGSNVTIGEELCFALLVTMSEGNSTDLILTDLLPNGLAYDSFTLVVDAASSNGLLTADFNGSVPVPSVSGGTFDGEDVNFTFGAITVAADGDATNDSFVLLVHTFVSDIPSNHDPLANTPVLTNNVSADVSNPQPPISSNPFDVTVIEPDLSVTIDNGVATLTAGQTTTYSITIANDGDSLATGIELTGTLPIDRVSFVSTDDAANFSIDGSGNFTWTPAVASLAPSGSLTLLLTVQVSSSLDAGITDVTIPVSVTHDNIEPTPANNSADDTDALDAAPDLRLTKTDFTNSISPGQGSVYTINIANVGTQAATNVLVTETVPVGTLFNAALSDPLWTLIAPDTYQISLPTLAAGAGFNIDFSVTINSPASSGHGDIVNTVTIEDDGSNGGDPNPGDNSATDTNTLDAVPDYQITIDDSEVVVVPGQSLSYTISFTNAGVQDGTGVVVFDIFPTAILENVVASDGGLVDDIAGAITWNVGNLAAGESRSFTVTAKVRDTVPAGSDDFTHETSITDDLTNGVDPTVGNNAAVDTDTLDATPDYRIAITDGESVVAPGQSLSYTVSFLNAGNQDGTGVVISDTFPPEILENVVASDGGIVDAVAGTITWNVGNLAAGESRSFTVTAKVRDTVPAGFDDFTHATTITDDATNGTDPTVADNSAADSDTLDAEPDYQVSIDDGLLTATTGQSLTYSVTFANAGFQDGTGVVVSTSFPLSVLTNVVASNGGIVDMTSGSIVWAVGDLAAGASLTYTVTADVLSSVAAGIDDFTHSATITDDSANGADPNTADNAASDTDTLDAAPDLQLTKTDFTNTISPLECSTYTINVANFGTQGSTNILVTETVPVGATFNAALSDPGWINVGGNVYQFSCPGLAAGDFFNINFSVLIDYPAVAGQDELINTATIADDGTNGPDRDPTNDSATDTNTLDAVPMYDIGIDDLQLAAAPGESLTYFVNFNNYGLQNGTGVVVSANFPIAILTNVIASDGGVVDAVAGTITWNVGNLTVDDHRTFEITADVRAVVPAGVDDFTLSAAITDDGTNGPDPDLSDNSSSDTDTLNAQPDYHISIDDGETFVRPGDPLTYNIEVCNDGNQDGTGVVVTVDFPTTLLQDVVASNGGIVDPVAGTITWNLGDLDVGEEVGLTVTTRVRMVFDPRTPFITLTATITDDGTNGADPSPLNNTGNDTDRLQVYAYDTFHDWKEMRTGFLLPQAYSVGRPLPPLPVDPVFSGLTEPGSTLTARIYSADGRLLGDRQVIADSAGNWLVSFPNIVIYEYPHRMEIIVTPAINNLAHENGFNLRRYFHPAIHAGLVMTEPLSVASVFRNRAYNIVEAQHSANTHPLGFQWYSHAYELNAASSNVSQM